MGIFSSRSKNETTAEVAAEFSNAPASSITAARAPVKLVKGNAPATDRVTLEKRGAAPDLIKRFEKAGVSLSKRDLAGIRGQVVLYVDHSGSMTNDYRSGLVQAIVERALGFALQIDSDGTIPVIAWDTVLHDAVDVTVDNYVGIVDRKVWRKRQMGGTALGPVFEDIIKRAKATIEPLFVIIVTDGEPWDQAKAEALALESASYPDFIKFLTTIDSDFAEYLDDEKKKLVNKRLLDNVDAKTLSGKLDIHTLSDLAFADVMTDEIPGWLKAAGEKNLIV